jgi:hypothetical protein
LKHIDHTRTKSQSPEINEIDLTPLTGENLEAAIKALPRDPEIGALYKKLAQDGRCRLGSRPLKKPHMLRCAQSARSNVHAEYASARRFFARLVSESF